MTVSIKALQEARAKMTPGEWRLSDDGAMIITGRSGGTHDNLSGSIAIHGAMEVLVEVALTALRLSAAGEAFANTKWPKGSAMRRGLELAAIEAETKHLAALAKVSW